MIFNRVRISRKIWVPTIVSALGLIALTTLALTMLQKELMAERQSMIRANVEAAVSIAEHYFQLAQSGAMGEEEAQERALESIRHITFEDGRNYIFGYTVDGVTLAIGKRTSLLGKNRYDTQTKDGRYLIREIIATGKTGGGIVGYKTRRTENGPLEDKISWVTMTPGWNWILGSGVYTTEVKQLVFRKAIQFTLIAVFVLMFAAVLAYIIILGIVRPLRNLTGAMKTLASGNLDIFVPDTDRSDEVGEMAQAVLVFQKNAQEVDRLHAEHATQARRNERRVRGEMLALTNALDEQVRSAISKVLTQSDTMHEAANEMARAVEQSSGGAGAAATASRDASTSVDAVAAAAEELSSSIAEISAQVASAATVAQKAVDEAESTNQKVSGLAKAASEIGEVVNLISDIAKQTNLLALNATIEAARAGEAGKGFAVVANEVKTLANQTANATEDIARQIGDMQSATDQAVGAIKGIGSVISTLSEIITAISGAVEEQNAATGEISQNAQQAARSTLEASENINRVSSSSEVADLQARHVQTASEDVRGLIRRMHEDLDKIVRATQSEGGRSNVLHTVNVAVSVELPDGRRAACLLNDISSNGVAILDRSFAGKAGQEFTLTLPDVGTLTGAVVASTDTSTHIRLDLTGGQGDALTSFINRRKR